jgi:hypothetical protein
MIHDDSSLFQTSNIFEKQKSAMSLFSKHISNRSVAKSCPSLGKSPYRIFGLGRAQVFSRLFYGHLSAKCWQKNCDSAT